MSDTDFVRKGVFRDMDLQELLVTMQHTPLPERMGTFERTCSPKEARELGNGAWLIVEYQHMSEEVRFQVVAQGQHAQFQVVQGGDATVLRTSTVEEAGHILRSDLLMMLEDVEDEL